MSKNISLSMGALSKPLVEQFIEQGFVAPKQIELYQQDADAITRLLIRGFIPPSVAHKARQKLVKEIGKAD